MGCCTYLGSKCGAAFKWVVQFDLPSKCVTDGEYEMKAEAEVPEGEEAPKVMIRSGTGVYKLDDNEYEGAWQDDRMHGKGQLKFMKGSLYWVQSPFHCTFGRSLPAAPPRSTLGALDIDGSSRCSCQCVPRCSSISRST